MMCRLTKAIILSLLIFFCSCNSAPDLERGGEYPDDKQLSISYLKSLYTNVPVVIEEQVHLKGRVISSDRYGNIYKSLYIEDQTGGMEVRVGDQELFRRFKLGEIVVVRCNSLWLGSYGGSVILGSISQDGIYEVDPIAEEQIDNVVIATGESQESQPTMVKISELSYRNIDCLVELNGVQFIDEELGLSWSNVEENTDRHLVDLAGDTLVVRTNYNSLFAQYILPSGSGNIRAILGYFNRNYQLIMISPHDLAMEGERFEVEL